MALQDKLAGFIANHGFTPILNINGESVAFFIPQTLNGVIDDYELAEVSTFDEARAALGY